MVRMLGTGLFLTDAPLSCPAGLPFQEPVDKRRPGRAGLHMHDAALLVQAHDLAHAAHVQVQRVFAELLPTHAVARASDADRLLRSRRLSDQRRHLGGGMRPLDARDTRSVECGLCIVEDHADSYAPKGIRLNGDRGDVRAIEVARAISGTTGGANL